MRISCENFPPVEATPGLISELVRDDLKRGEFMVLEQDDGETFIQAAGEYETNEDGTGGGFVLEDRDGKTGILRRCRDLVPAAELEQIFLDELSGFTSWRGRYEWVVDRGFLSSLWWSLPKPRKIALCITAAVIVVLTIIRVSGCSVREVVEMGNGVVSSITKRYSVDDRLREIEARKPALKKVAESLTGGITLLVFKKERCVELLGEGLPGRRTYKMTKFSGTLGPKLREGDGQIPEGVYGCEYLNPNSRFHLSLKVSYPNALDKEKGEKEGRARLGGDIMIHGGAATVGCVPVGDDNIEDIFYLAAKAGKENVQIIISPYDMRNGRKKELEKSPLKWYGALCDMIEQELARHK